jgi:DegV family protein with EDD domain
MGPVRIVTDSTADVPPDLASELAIAVVPCQVYLDGVVYQDGVDLSAEELYAKLSQSSELPRTSQPPVSQFLQTFQRLVEKEQSQKVISIHLPSSLSGTVNAAWSAAQMLADPSRVEIIDSGQISMGIGWAVIEAARLAQSGAQAAEISPFVRALLPRLRTAAMIDTLENLYKGGRISQISALVGTALQIKPLLSIQDGVISVWGRVRTRSRAIEQLVTRVRGWEPLVEMAVLHTGAEQLALSVASTLQDLVPASRMVIQPAGPAITCHLGLGAVGVAALAAASEDAAGNHMQP